MTEKRIQQSLVKTVDWVSETSRFEKFYAFLCPSLAMSIFLLDGILGGYIPFYGIAFTAAWWVPLVALVRMDVASRRLENPEQIDHA